MTHQPRLTAPGTARIKRWTWALLGVALLLARFPEPTAVADDTLEVRPFRFGFSTALIPEVNENDSRAAMKVWAESVLGGGTIWADPSPVILPGFESILKALREGTVDGVAMSTVEFAGMRDQVRFNRYVVGLFDGGISDSYVLLVHRDSGLNRVEDLTGRTLVAQKSSRSCLAVPWLDTVLMEKGLGTSHQRFGRVIEEEKLTKAVLPVFFRKLEACLVGRKGFRTMTELNPQVGKQLRELASSPEFVPTGFFFREGYSAAGQERCLRDFTQVHATVSGQQILTVFQTERLVEYPPSVFDSAVELLVRHRRLTQQIQATAPGAERIQSPGKETGRP